jgi:hypothetical protein
MSSILDLLNSDLGKSLINGAAAQTGQSTEKTSNVLSQAMPLILGAMQRNAATPQGAQSLNKALEDPRHTGGGMVDLLGSLMGGGDSSSLLNEGAGILGHVLGGKQPQVENALSKTSGMDTESIAQILKIAAPIVMGMLSKQKQVTNTDQNGIGGLLGNVLGQGGGGNQSFLESILDANNDGSIIDDVAGMVMGGSKKKGGLGGLLGGLFGGK